MDEGCEVHFCPIYRRIPHLNSINLVVWSESCWCKLDTTSSSLAILLSKTRPDVQEHNNSGVSHQYTLRCSSVAVKYCTLVWERKLVNLLFPHCSVSALQLFKSSGATCYSSHSLVLTRLFLNQEKAPQTPEFPPFLLWETAYTFARLLPFTKVYKEPESFLTSFFISSWLWERCQSVACNLFRGSSVGDISLCHTFTHLLFPISPPLSIYFFFSV